jgi:polar amino acid transport system substrate-binding protein
MINKITTQMEQNMTEEELLSLKFSIIANAFVDTKNLNKNEFFSRVFETVFLLIPEAQKGSFYELDGDVFRPVFGKGYDMELLKELAFSKDEAFIDYYSPLTQEIDAYQVNINKRDDSLFSERQITIFKQLGTYSDFASLYAPIKLDDVKIGLLCLENFDKKMFSETSRLVLKIFARLISNFYSYKVYQELESKRYKDIIDALVSAIEIKDVYTEGHAKRVSEISIKIAQVMDIPTSRFRTIEIAAILHDIGKIGTPTEILNKASSLTEEEFEIIKRHPLDAKKILDKIQGFEEISDLTYRHHEYFDGSGYPEGLSGDQIPIEAHIIQAADALDAMTSKRAYREAMSIETALNIFIKEKGKQFHPEVTDAVLKLF